MNYFDKQYKDHYPVMIREVIEQLKPVDGEHYLDCTFGAGGYSRAILQSAKCNLTAFDQDINTKPFADQLISEFGERFKFIQSNFSQARQNCSEKFDAIILDLGVSSMQLDQAERGFSFMRNGPLDMRMSPEAPSAEYVINHASEAELADIIFLYGEERKARQIAKQIILHREKEAINSTLQLANIVRQVVRAKPGQKIDPATKTFQAIRIHVNQELEALRTILHDSKELLKENGRLIIVSFHSLEDSIVKNFFKEHSAKKVARSKYAAPDIITDPNIWLQVVTKKPITPAQDELKINIRSRSAKMRVAQKIGGANVD